MFGWSPNPGQIVTRSARGKTFVFINRDGREFRGRQRDFAEACGLSAASASRVTRHGGCHCVWLALAGKS